MKAQIDAPPIQFGIDWTEAAKRSGQKFVPLVQRHAFCAYHNVGNGTFWHRKERIKAMWPKYQWHRWNERRLRGAINYHWLTWLAPGAAGKTSDAACFGVEYWLEAPDRTAVICCSTTM